MRNIQETKIVNTHKTLILTNKVQYFVKIKNKKKMNHVNQISS